MTTKSGFAIGADFLMLTSAFAQTDGPNASPKDAEPTAQSQAVEYAHLADELAAYGREAGNAMALIVAAELQARAGGRAVEREKTSESTGSGPAGDKAGGASPDTVASLLTDARELAGGDTALTAAIERVASLESRGRVEGPAYHTDRVLARTNDIYNINFRGGEPAIVSINGDGDTDLDLYIYDQNGNLICRNTNYTDNAICRWHPVWTGPFRVEVRNLGNVWNQYVLRTN